jgi:2-oxoglutarate/2-oxoacid ferredoxin oxidoreductase subunit alpha
VNVQRVGPSTGQPTAASQGDIMQARWGTHGDHPIIALAPTSVRNSFDITITAFELSEKFRIPVLLMTDEIIGHMRECVELPDFKTIQPKNYRVTEPGKEYIPFRNSPGDVPPLANFGTGYRYHITGLLHNQAGLPTQRLEDIDPWIERLNTKLDKHIDEITQVESDYQKGAKVALLSYGCSARTAQHAMKVARAQGKKVNLLILYTLWPFPEKEVEALGDMVDRIVVPEMNLGQLAYEVERVAGRKKVKRVGLANGDMVTPQMVLDAMEA